MNFRQAFTLIELLVVIAVIGILSGLIVVSMSGTTQKATIAKAQVFSNSLRNSLMLNLISEWKFDETSGTSAADTWGSNTATTTNGTFTSSDCVYGSCLSLSGSSTYVDLGSNASLLSVFDAGKSFTYSLWFYPTSFPATSYWDWLVCKAYTSHVSPYYQIMSLVRPTAYIESTIMNTAGSSYITGISSSAGSVTLNNWHFLVISADLSLTKHRMYLNGNLISPAISTSGTYINHATALALGNNKNIYTSSYGFNGKLDEFRVYDAFIPLSKIEEQYFSGLNDLFISKQITSVEYLQKLSGIAQN
jgi:prepilin-type N-terminal cleavage/methylation domain-containing protein